MVNEDSLVKATVSTHRALHVVMLDQSLLTVLPPCGVRRHKILNVFDALDAVCVVSNVVDIGSRARPVTGYVRLQCE